MEVNAKTNNAGIAWLDEIHRVNGLVGEALWKEIEKDRIEMQNQVCRMKRPE